jgi:hypothetical protein
MQLSPIEYSFFLFSLFLFAISSQHKVSSFIHKVGESNDSKTRSTTNFMAPDWLKTRRNSAK